MMELRINVDQLTVACAAPWMRTHAARTTHPLNDLLAAPEPFAAVWQNLKPGDQIRILRFAEGKGHTWSGPLETATVLILKSERKNVSFCVTERWAHLRSNDHAEN
jgi:hypothetical protein